ncbi:MAG: alanine/ornithine racemase family PLP-dependent enzyme [Tissierellia bacterium]|nr:alanine/ornithine racemase family PLP-dependent enzyme [Tissierellia bacterium]
MRYPILSIDSKKLKNNIEVIKSILGPKVNLVAVTKMFLSEPEIVKIYLETGINLIADSRIDNLKKISGLKCQKMLLRIPSFSEAQDVVKFSDISLNSEYETIKYLNRFAQELNILHRIILMIDFGDLREGYFNREELFSDIEKIIKLGNIKIEGIGLNLKCYGGVIPTSSMMKKISIYREKIEERFDIEIKTISGGNSSSIYLAQKGQLYSVNNLRIGEAIVLGRELAYDKRIEGTYEDIVRLKAQIIEIKEKPSIPIGETGLDSFGHKVEFVDRGIRKRAIVALGKLDIPLDSISTLDEDAIILGASSDHMIIDISDSDIKYKLGDIIEFKLDYSGILMASSSDYIDKIIVNEV